MARPKRTAGAEYRLLINPATNNRTQTPIIRVILQTTQTFASFRYELSVEEHRERNTVHYRVRGLNPPELSLPSAGHAQFVREYEDLWGTCEFRVTGLDGVTSSCTVRLTPMHVKVLKPASARRLTVLTGHAESEGHTSP